MLPSRRLALCLFLFASPLCAQIPKHIGDAEVVPPTKLTEKQKQHRKALILYAQAVRYEKRNELTKALRLYEEAINIDPEPAAGYKALVPIYLALDRRADALQACRDTLQRDPGDYDTWHRYAGRLHSMSKRKEAINALEKGLQTPKVKEAPRKQAIMLDDLGMLYEEAKLFDKAEKVYREEAKLLEENEDLRTNGFLKYEKLQQQLAETWQRVGEMALKNRHPEEAVLAFEKSRKLDPTRSLRFYLNLAEVFSSQNKHAKALQYLSPYLARQPAETKGYELLIRILKKMGKSNNDILRELRTRAQRDSQNRALQLLWARELVKADRRKDAVDLYNELIVNSPSEAVYRALFDLHESEGVQGIERILVKLDVAIKKSTQTPPPPGATSSATQARYMLVVLRKDRALVKKILNLAHKALLSRRSSYAYRTRLILGVLAVRTYQVKEAEDLYRSCMDRNGKVRRDKGERNYEELEQTVYDGLLRTLLWQAKYEEVIRVCEQGLKHAEVTNYVLFYVNLGQAHSSLGRHEEALKAVKKAVEHASDLNRLLCEKRYVYIMSAAGKHDEAIARAKKLLKEFTGEKDVREIRHALSLLCSRAGKWEESEKYLKAMIETDPSDATAYNDLGYHWADRNRNLEEAERMIRKAIRLDREERNSGLSVAEDSDQDNAAYLDSLGWVLFRRGKLKAALKELKKASNMPDGQHDPVMWDHLGDVHFRLKQSKEALKCWKKALQLYEENRRPKSDDRYRDLKHKIQELSE